MKVALTVWEGRISPVFDVSREALVLDIENGTEAARCLEGIEAPTPELKVDKMLALGVETVICGAISEPLQNALTSRGIEVIGFVAGEIEEVLAAFLEGALPTEALSMPGCCGRQRRFRGGRAQAGRQCRGTGKRARR